MKSKKTSYLETLAREVDSVVTGATAAARVSEVLIRKDGSAARREVEPETSRAEAARNFEVRSVVASVRHRLDLSQEAFARRLRIPLSTLQKWERNATQPTGAAATLIEILDRRPDVIDVLAE